VRRALLAVFSLVFASSAVYLAWLPDVSFYKRHNPTTTAFIELQKARLGKKFRPRLLWTPWNEISDNLKHAVLVSEDDMFYQHGGVDWDAVRVAFAKDWEQKRLAYGASTITQQVARNLYLSPSKNPLRKLKELLIARRLEHDLGKRRIFELYLNIAEWGKGVYGCGAAARAYFNKSCSDLSVDESVALAVVLPSPRRHDPSKPGKYVARNSARIMTRMRMSGFLPDEDGETFIAPSTPTVIGPMVPGETPSAVLQ